MMKRTEQNNDSNSNKNNNNNNNNKYLKQSLVSYWQQGFSSDCRKNRSISKFLLVWFLVMIVKVICICDNKGFTKMSKGLKDFEEECEFCLFMQLYI